MHKDLEWGKADISGKTLSNAAPHSLFILAADPYGRALRSYNLPV